MRLQVGMVITSNNANVQIQLLHRTLYFQWASNVRSCLQRHTSNTPSVHGSLPPHKEKMNSIYIHSGMHT